MPSKTQCQDLSFSVWLWRTGRGRDDRGRSDRDHRRGRDDEDRHRSSRHRSPEDRDRRSTRSKSRSRTPPRRTRKPRKSQWDILPPDGVPLAPINTGQPAPIMAAAPVAAPLPIPAPIIPIPGVGAVPLTAVALPGLGEPSCHLVCHITNDLQAKRLVTIARSGFHAVVVWLICKRCL